MSRNLIFVGTYAIPAGKLGEFQTVNTSMGDFVHANEPRILSWHTYLNAAGDEATTIMALPGFRRLIRPDKVWTRLSFEAKPEPS